MEELSVTMRQGISTCILKGDKDKLYLSNWRPIYLLNVAYKIASASIATRLKKILSSIINEDQSGFLPGRYIGDNIRVVYDVMLYSELNKIPGLLLLLDFATAFDSLSWKFMYKTLAFFNFGPNLIKWVKLFYNNICSSVIVNGHLSDWFNLHRGCRQGDPLSPYLFIICAEILSILIRQNNKIKGITINNCEFLISQYADDTTLLLDGTEQSLRETMLLLKFYANMSGLHININKTKAFWIGSNKNRPFPICQDLNWEFETFNLLGITFTKDLSDMVNLNYNKKIEEIRTLFYHWSKRILTPIGKIVIIKTLALSKINYLIMSLPNPSTNYIKNLQNLMFNFLWSGKPDKVKRNLIIQDYQYGGLRMLDLENFMTALKVTWLRRYLLYSSKHFKLVQKICPQISQFSSFGNDYIKSSNISTNNPFWGDVFNSYLKFTELYTVKSWEEIINVPIWHNSLLKINGSSFFLKKYYEKGILFIGDILKDNGEFLSFENLIQKYNVQTNFLQYRSLISCIKCLFRKSKLTQCWYFGFFIHTI